MSNPSAGQGPACYAYAMQPCRGALGVSVSVCRLLCKARVSPTPPRSSHCCSCQQTIDCGEDERVMMGGRGGEIEIEGESLQREKNINSNWSETPIRVRSMECLLWQRIFASAMYIEYI